MMKKPGASAPKPMESKKTAAAEIAAMKRGGASKSLIGQEKAEHKAMGYSKGGSIGKLEGMKSKPGLSSGGSLGGYDGKKPAKKR